MAVLTSQKIKDFYDRFKGIEVVYTKEIAAATGLDPRQIHLKCVSGFYPCIIYASTFESAKVVVNIKSGILEKLKESNNALSLRFCFKHFETEQQVIFFVQARVSGYTPYKGSEDMMMFSLQFSQHPPDDLIEIIGRVLDASINASKRKEERILITPETMRKLKLATKDAVAFIDSVPRRCILRDISFSGARLVMVGVSKFLIDKQAGVRLDFTDPPESHIIKGKFVRAESVSGRKDLVVLGMLFEQYVPMAYKLRLSDYLNTVKTVGETTQPQTEVDSAGVQSAAPVPDTDVQAT